MDSLFYLWPSKYNRGTTGHWRTGRPPRTADSDANREVISPAEEGGYAAADFPGSGN